MNKNKFTNIAKDVISAEVSALNKLKSYISLSFNHAVKTIVNCKEGKIIISGVGKSGIIAKKISSTLASVGCSSFFVDASSCSHGDMGQISTKDVLMLISHSGDSEELKNIIQHAKRNKIVLIGITSKKNSLLYKTSNIKLLTPEVKEADSANIVPTSSTIVQLAIGDALSIACMKHKNFGKLDFKKFHPGGSLAIKLKTVEDLMVKGKKIPFISENKLMKDALKIISKKKLGVLIVRKKIKTVGIVVDGDIKRAIQKNKNLHELKIRSIMTKKPISVDKNMLAAEALSIMNSKKITSLCIHKNNIHKRTIGLIHIHHILKSNIN